MIFAPTPANAAHSSCSATDLPEPDLPNTATLWLPALFSNGDQKKGWPRRPMNIRCGRCPPRYSPWIGSMFAAGEVSIVRSRFMRLRSLSSPLPSVIGRHDMNAMIWRNRSSSRSHPAALYIDLTGRSLAAPCPLGLMMPTA